jgi:hypothetical protein
MAEQRKRLDVYVKADLRDFVYEESERTGKPLNATTDELLEVAIAFKRGEIIEQQSLPVISDIVYTALRRHRAELRAELKEDMHMEVVDVLRETIRKATDRVVKLNIRTLRDTIVIRRLVYTIIAKAYGKEFARSIFEDARDKAGQELAPNSRKEEEQK